MIGKEIPEGFKSVTKVYVVNYDNGEPYEDGFHCIDNIFSTYEEAEKYLIDMDTIKREWGFGKPTWSFPKYVCSMNNMDCEDCPKREQDVDENGYRYCEEEFERDTSEYDNSFYTIEEYNLLTNYPMCTFDVRD